DAAYAGYAPTAGSPLRLWRSAASRWGWDDPCPRRGSAPDRPGRRYVTPPAYRHDVDEAPRRLLGAGGRAERRPGPHPHRRPGLGYAAADRRAADRAGHPPRLRVPAGGGGRGRAGRRRLVAPRPRRLADRGDHGAPAGA